MGCLSTNTDHQDRPVYQVRLPLIGCDGRGRCRRGILFGLLLPPKAALLCQHGVWVTATCYPSRDVVGLTITVDRCLCRKDQLLIAVDGHWSRTSDCPAQMGSIPCHTIGTSTRSTILVSISKRRTRICNLQTLLLPTLLHLHNRHMCVGATIVLVRTLSALIQAPSLRVLRYLAHTRLNTISWDDGLALPQLSHVLELSMGNDCFDAHVLASPTVPTELDKPFQTIMADW